MIQLFDLDRLGRRRDIIKLVGIFDFLFCRSLPTPSPSVSASDNGLLTGVPEAFMVQLCFSARMESSFNCFGTSVCAEETFLSLGGVGSASRLDPERLAPERGLALRGRGLDSGKRREYLPLSGLFLCWGRDELDDLFFFLVEGD